MANIAKVMKYLMDRPGQVVYAEDIAEGTELSREKVASTVNNARHGHEEFRNHLEIMISGHAWRYQPTNGKKAEAEYFERIGVTKDGSLILESEDGTLYKATEL